jgi:lipopolysaccharide/colanic/teichoic acid biosynthesis glycosyltransferase
MPVASAPAKLKLSRPAPVRRVVTAPARRRLTLPVRQRQPRRTNPAEVLDQIESGRPIVAPQGNGSLAYQATKRALDIVGALGLLVLLSPILLTTLIVLKITTKGRPLFCQRRVGLQGKLFPMLKFRTMRLDAAKIQHTIRNEQAGPIFKNRRDPRITRIGRLLRKTSIDEMPQLLNVLVGHMSLVGPRPPIAEEVAKYELWQRRRLSVRPGLTCLWQVSGRSDIGFEDWVRMDIWYVNNQRLWTDLTLLVKTPLSVITCRGAY